MRYPSNSFRLFAARESELILRPPALCPNLLKACDEVKMAIIKVGFKQGADAGTSTFSSGDIDSSFNAALMNRFLTKSYFGVA